MAKSPAIASERVDTSVVLSVRDLSVEYRAARGSVRAVRGASFDLRKGESLALIGESGSGKTTLGLALVRLLPRAARITSGTITYAEEGKPLDVLAMDERHLRRFRWESCAMVFQGAQNSFNPVLTIGSQFRDTFQAHRSSRGAGLDERSASERSWETKIVAKPSWAWSSLKRSIMARWVRMSSAVVGSSRMSTCGWRRRLMAMSTRCRMPPDSSWGYERSTRSGSSWTIFKRLADRSSSPAPRELRWA